MYNWNEVSSDLRAFVAEEIRLHPRVAYQGLLTEEGAGTRVAAALPAPLGPSRLLDQCSDKSQQGVMLGAIPAVHEEVRDLNMCRLTAGGCVGLVLNDHSL